MDMTWSDGTLTALPLRALGPGALGTHRLRCGERSTEVTLGDTAPVSLDLGWAC